MAADNWRELLDDTQVEDIIRRVHAHVSARIYQGRRDQLLRDDLESWLWDRAVDVAEAAPADLTPGSGRFHGWLYVGLSREASLHHRDRFNGAAGRARRAATETMTYIDHALADNREDIYLQSRHLLAADPLVSLLRIEALEALLRKLEREGPPAYSTESSATCAEPMCTKPVNSLGLCAAHYTRYRINRMPPCTVPGCTTGQKARGMCDTHYQADRKRRRRERGSS